MINFLSLFYWLISAILIIGIGVGCVLLAAQYSTTVFLIANTARVFVYMKEIMIKRLTLHELFEREWLKLGNKSAIEYYVPNSPPRRVSYNQLISEVRKVGNWALKENMKKDEVIALISPNTPEYLFCYYGFASVGITVAMINSDAQGASLEHALKVAKATRIIVHPSKQEQLLTVDIQPFSHIYVLPESGSASLDPDCQIQHPSFELISAKQLNNDEAIDRKELQHLTLKDPALYIYTSGTTGMPKATKLAHRKMVEYPVLTTFLSLKPSDRMFVCLPLFHTSGLAFGTSMLYHGGTLILAKKFSTRHTYAQIVASKATIFLYIGELCRYMLSTPPEIASQPNKLRKCIGNGLRASVWETFQNKFNIPQIMEFYTATEAGFALFNFNNVVGSVGWVPRILLKIMTVRIVKYNVEQDEYERDANGFMIECGPNEPGELISKVVYSDTRVLGGRFTAYTNEKETNKKLLKDVFVKGDTWWRSGDILKQDEEGNYYFVDRIGDTFRFKGHNVSTAEVEAVYNQYLQDQVEHVAVYGMSLENVDGKCGMVCICVDNPNKVDLDKLASHAASSLQAYAIPLLLRFKTNMNFTSTFKIKKHDLMKEGIDVPHLYAWNASSSSYDPVTPNKVSSYF